MTETIQESPIVTNSNKPAKQKKLWIGVVGSIVTLSVLAIGFQAYKKYSFKSALRPHTLKDNILTEDMLEFYRDKSKSTIRDSIDKGKKNMEAREQIIQDLRMVDPGSYKKELDMYVDLLKLENEYVYSEVSDSNSWLDVRVAEAEKKEKERMCDEMTAYSRNLVCGEESMQELADRVYSAKDKWVEIYKNKKEVINKWLFKEKDYQKTLSGLLPVRHVIPKLEEIVAEYEQMDKK